MRMIAIALLVAAQVATAAQPAAAAELVDQRPAVERKATGSFAGARVSVQLGAKRAKARAALAVAPALRPGNGELRIGKGLELGFAGDDKVRLSLGGQPVSRLAGAGEGPEGRKLGVSPLGWVAIGVGVAAVAYFAWFFHEMGDCDEHDDEC